VEAEGGFINYIHYIGIAHDIALGCERYAAVPPK